MVRVFVLSSDITELRRAIAVLERGGIAPVLMAPSADAIGLLKSESPDAAILDLTSPWPAGEPAGFLQAGVPDGCRTIAIVPEERLGEVYSLALDDFILHPLNGEEVLARLTRLLSLQVDDATHVIRFNDLTIDTANYSVTLMGDLIDLTYKEYELLRFLATNPSRVFTREALLNRVWGYDYYGGSRTVDVHIRRLRAKIEDRSHTFIDTVRNVGYRFHAG
ncbi:MAG: response regulator transcription factor [Dehalococcoidia bacterium]|nr:response regulator transcription factor [Dehalococcoidia bacterium]